jgi:excisionase family DNA binding protein
MQDNLRQLLTLQEACVWLQYTEQTVKRLAREGKIPGRKIGSRWRFEAEELKAWLKNQKG